MRPFGERRGAAVSRTLRCVNADSPSLQPCKPRLPRVAAAVVGGSVLVFLLGAIVLALAGAGRLAATTAGSLVLIALLAVAALGLFAVWRRHTEYR